MRFSLPAIPRALRRRTVVIGAVVVLLAASTTGWLLLRKTPAAAASTTTATVSRGTVKQTVAASGTVAAAHSDDVSFAVSGTITRVYVAAGAKVRKGQRLARIDDATLVADRTAAESALAAAEEQLSQDRDDDASSVQLASDAASVDSAQAALAQARADVEHAVLRATMTGTVTAVGLAVGDAVGGSAASSATGTATSAVTIVSGAHYVVDADLSAADAASVKTGMQAAITVTGVDSAIYGTVRSVSLVAETGDSGAAVFPVVIAVTGAQKDLYAGVSADATITTKVRQNVLTVATQAVHSDSEGTYVDKVVNGAAVRAAVTLGATYGMSTEVTAGLAAGDQVQVVAFRLPSGAGGSSDQQQMRQMVQEGGFPGGGFPAGGLPGGGQ